MNKLQEQMLKMLIDSDSYITTSFLASKLNVSSKTVSRHLNSLQDFIKNNGALIKVIPGLGIKLEIMNDNNFNLYISEINNKA